MTLKLGLDTGSESGSAPRLYRIRTGTNTHPEAALHQQFAAETSRRVIVDYWGMLGRNWMFLIGLGAAGLGAGYGISRLQTPVYRAHFTLQLDPTPQANPREPNDTTPFSGAEFDLPTQIKVLESRSLADRVIDRLNLAQNDDFLKSSGFVHEAKALLGVTEAALPESKVVEQRRAMAEGVLAKNLKVRPSGQTRIVEMTFDHHRPQLGARVLNTLASEYAARDFETRASLSQSTNDWLTAQLSELKGKLERSEVELQSYARHANIIPTANKTDVADEKLKEIQQAYSAAQANRAMRDSQYEIALNSPPDSLPEVLDSATMHEYKAKLGELRRQWADLDTVLTPENPKLPRLRSQITEVQGALERERANIVRRVGNEAAAAKRREALLQASFEEQSKKVTDLAFRSTRYDMLKREVDTNRQMYEFTLQKIKGGRISSALNLSNIHFLDSASTPERPHSPSAFLNSWLGLMCGLFSGVLVGLLREHGDQTLRSPGTSMQVLGTPVLGVIPRVKRELRAKTRPGLSLLQGKKAIIPLQGELPDLVETAAWHQRHCSVSDAYHSVLTSILFQGKGGKQPLVIAVTSALPEEGKTTTACNLAITAAEIMGKVLIIDGDHRKPNLHSIFDVPNTWGLSDLLRETSDVESLPLEGLVRPTGIPGVSILPAGAAAMQFSSLLHGDRMRALLRRFRKEFQMVVIDTPPTLVLPDARIIGRHSDGMVLVVRHAHTLRGNALASVMRLRQDLIPIIGTVLNDWEHRRHYGYYGTE